MFIVTEENVTETFEFDESNFGSFISQRFGHTKIKDDDVTHVHFMEIALAYQGYLQLVCNKVPITPKSVTDAISKMKEVHRGIEEKAIDCLLLKACNRYLFKITKDLEDKFTLRD